MRTITIFLIISFLCAHLVFSSGYAGKTANIILICGQSNAAGNALKTAVNKSQFTSLDTVKYSQAGDSNLSLTLGKTFTLTEFLNSTYTKHGLELGLGEGLHNSGMSDIFIVKYAWGGSWIDLWRKDNTTIFEGKSNLYNNAMSFLQIKVNEMKQLGYSRFSFQGLVWLQGESDAILTGRANVYESKLNTLLTNFRSDIAGVFNIASKDVPIYLVQPATYADKTKYESSDDEAKVINALSSYALNNSHSEFIPTNDLTGYVDAIHFNTLSQSTIGARVAEKMKIIPKTIINVKDYGAVGDGITDDGPAIDAAFAEASNFKGNAIVSFEKKIYFVGEKATKWHYFNLENLDNLEIEGNGAELQFTRTNQPFSFIKCTNLRVRNLSVDFIEPTYTQGVVVAKNSAKGTIDLLIQDGFPLPPLNLKNFGGGAHGIVFEPIKYTRRLFPDIDDDHFLIDSVSLVNGRTYRFYFTSSYYKQVNYIQIGDRITHGFAWFYMNADYFAKKTTLFRAFAIAIRECSDVLFENFNLYASLIIGIGVNNNMGDVTFRHVNIMRKPGTERLMSTHSDGIHSDNNRGAIIIDSCFFESTGDDMNSLHSKEEKIVSKLNSTTFELITTDNPLEFNIIKENDKLMFIDRSAGDVLGVAFVKKVSFNTSTKTHTVVLDREVINLEVGITAIDLTSGSSGTTIKNSTFKPVLRNAMLLRILNGKIDNNTINCLGGKIGVNLTDETNTGPFSKNIIVKNNIINDADLIGINIGCNMSGVREDTTATGNIQVIGNTINCRRLNGIKIRNTNRVNILNNSINMLGGTISKGNAVEATNVRDVTIDDMTINDQRTGMLNNTAMRFSNCVEESFSMSKLNFNLTQGMSNYVFLNSLTTYYVRPSGDAISWTNLPDILPTQIITTNTPSIISTNTYYFAKGIYTKSAISLTSGNIYGGFKGDESVIDLSARELSDKDGNGIVEPWEFTNETIITGTSSFSGSGTTSRFLTVTGGEINGVTFQDHYFNDSSNSGAIILGVVSSSPAVTDNIFSAAGKLVSCTVKKIKSYKAPIMLTNKSSLIDGCLIEECVSTSTTGTAAVFMNLLGGKVSNSVLRNNYNAGSLGGGIFASSLSNTDMDAIVENCVLYNNTAKYGGAIRGEAKTDKRGIQITNCTMANNKSTTATVASVDLISGGLIVNSIVLDDTENEIRANTSNHYVSNNVFGVLALGVGVTAYPNTDMIPGKTVADFGFCSPTTFPGAIITGDANFDQSKYDAIRSANYKINQPNSIGLSMVGLKVLPSSYLVGGTGVSVPLTATIPAIDILGTNRPISGSGRVSLGAYQNNNLTDLVSKIDTSISINPINEGIRISGAEGKTVNVYAISGQLVKSVYLDSDIFTIRVNKGFYIVVTGSSKSKVLVK